MANKTVIVRVMGMATHHWWYLARLDAEIAKHLCTHTESATPLSEPAAYFFNRRVSRLDLTEAYECDMHASTYVPT